MEHISSVENGMFMDNDPRLQPKGTYYYSIDGEIIDNGNGNYSWRNIRGNDLSFTLPDTGHKPLGFCVIGNSLVIISKGPTFDQISLVDILSTGYGYPTSAYPFYAGNLNLHEHNMIEIVASPETAQFKRIYWVDDRNQPRTLNLLAITHVASTQLIPTQRYIVISGSIATTIGGIPATPVVAANSFIAEITTFTGTGIVIEYLDPLMLNFTPSFTVAEIFFNRFINGNLMSGGYFVAAQFESLSGVISDWSIITDCIPVYKEIGPGNILNYQTAPGHNTVTVPIQTGHGIRMTIRNIDTNFNIMRLAVFYSDDYNVIQPGYKLGDVTITTTEMTYDIVDYSGLPLTIEELLLKGVSIEKAGTIAIIKNQLVPGRITEESNITANNLMIPGIPTTKSLYELPCDERVFHHTIVSDNPIAQVGHYGFDIATGGVLSGYIYPGQWYRATGDVVFYNGINYGPGQVAGAYFQGTTTGGIPDNAPISVFAATPGVLVVPVIRISEYTDALAVTHYKYYDINASWLDYKNPLVCQLLKGFWGGERYRIGLMPISLTNKQMRVIWLEDIDIPYRNNKIIGGPNYPLMQGYWLVNADPYGNYHVCWNVNIMSLLYNIDISEFINAGNPLIKGFCIVAAPLDKKIITDVFYTHSYYPGPFIGREKLCCPYSLIANYYYDFGSGTFLQQTQYSYLKYIYSPEFLFEMDSMPSEELYLKYLDIFDSERPINHAPEDLADPLWSPSYPYMFKNGHSIGPIGGGDKHSMFQRFYSQNTDTTIYVNKETNSLITKTVLLGLNALSYTYTVEATSTVIDVINGANVFYLDAVFYYIAQGGGEECYLTEIEDVTLGPDYRTGTITNEFDTNLAPMLHYGTIERILAEPYGGTSDSAIENTEYRYLGHYIELTPTVIANANYGGGVYKLKDIQIFGQDTYVYPWDLSRLYGQWWTANEPNLGSTNLQGRYLNHCICAPIQSTVNIALRRSTHVARDRYTNPVNLHYTSDGVYYDLSLASTSWRLDNHLYEKGFSSKFNDQIFLPAYENMPTNGDFKYRYRWSLVKLYGETVDSYLVFDVNNFRDLDPAHGQLTNLRSKLGRLYYWQEDTIGYIPVGEKALTSAGTAQLVELGTGESFSRYDDTISMAGNLHQFSMIETPDTFIWCDWKRKNILYMSMGFQKIEINKVLGIDYELNNLLFDYSNRYSPVHFNGIGGCYIERENKAIISFCCNDHISIVENKGIMINLDLRKVETVLSKGIALSANPNGYSLQYNPLDTVKIYVGGKQTWKLFNIDTTPYTIFCVNPQSVKEGNVFDSCILTGNENFFSSVTYYDSTDTVTENVISTTNTVLSRYYQYINKKWKFSIPLILTGTVPRKRFKDDYIFIKFAFNVTRNKLVKVISLLTNFRKTK